jgi:hypothetical protein
VDGDGIYGEGGDDDEKTISNAKSGILGMKIICGIFFVYGSKKEVF